MNIDWSKFPPADVYTRKDEPKDIRLDTYIMGHDTLEQAQREAANCVTNNGRVRIVSLRGAFFVVPDGQRCPCCKQSIKVEWL